MPKSYDKELGAILMVLSFFGSRTLAEDFIAESRSKSRSLEEWAGSMSEGFAEAMLGYAVIGRTIYEAQMQPAAKPSRPASAGAKIGRNAPCPCGSGRKYKQCCGAAVH